MRLLICGDRYWIGMNAIYNVVERYVNQYKHVAIIEGCCRGADRAAEHVAKHLKLEINHFPAKWRKFGKAAGPIRNQQMLDEGMPDVVLAFHKNLKESDGTFNMVMLAANAGIPVWVSSIHGKKFPLLKESKKRA